MLAMQHYNTSAFLGTATSFTNHTAGDEEAEMEAEMARTHNITGLHQPAAGGGGGGGGGGSPTAAGLSMTLGVLSNVVALLILAKAYNRFRRRSKATFLLFASCLVATDLAGHIIPGALVLRLYSTRKMLGGGGEEEPGLALGSPPPPLPPHSHEEEADTLCLVLGGSMVFFGLCPLFLGCAMAAERCLGVTRPLLHARLVTTARTKMALALIWLLALCVALLPFFGLGAYACQYPWTWCFIRVLGDAVRATDLAFVLVFSGLGLAAVAVALVCNTVSGVTLVRARLRKKSGSSSSPQHHHHRRSSSAKSHDIEMVAQLVGIMVTSCICWSPLLIFGLMSVTRSYSGSLGADRDTYRMLMVTAVRLASWNQILDPWVYILLRRAVLRRIYRITKRRHASFKGSAFRSLRSFRWDIGSFQSSEKSAGNHM